MGYVVAIPHVSQPGFSGIAKLFDEREIIRQRLAGMLQFTERVDHRNVGVLGHL